MANNPITWRTVQGPSLAEASRPLQIAQQTISSGFGTLADQLKTMETTDAANWDQIKKNNTNDFMNRLYAERGAEGFKALQDSGQLQQMLTNFGAQIDQAQARQALDTRLGTLQARDKAGWEYDNAALDNKEAPVVDQAKGLIAQGKLEEAKPLIATLSTRNQSGLYTSLDARTQEELRRDRDAKRFGWEEKEAPLKLEGLSLGNQGKKIQNALGGYQVTEAKQRVDDVTQLRTLEDTIARAGAQHSAERETAGRAQGALAAQLKLPVDARGFADLSNYTTEQLKFFDQNAAITGVPKSATTLAGDTMRADSFYDTLSKSGKFSPRVLKANEAAIRGAFNTPVGERGLVGNDAFNSVLARAQNQVGFDRQDSANWYAPGSQDARNSYDNLAKQLPDIVSAMPAGTWFGDNKKDIPALQGMLGEIASTGIRRKDGVYVTPSANDVLRFMRSEEGGFRDAKRAEDVRKKLEDWVNSPEGLEMAKKGLESQKWRDKDKVRALVAESLYGSPKK